MKFGNLEAKNEVLRQTKWNGDVCKTRRIL